MIDNPLLALRLFVNHRPVYGIGKNQIADALTDLLKGLNVETPGEISLAELKKILTSEGERMTGEEFDGNIPHHTFSIDCSSLPTLHEECLHVLCGDNEDQIPPQINAETLCEDILGFEDLEGEERDDNVEDQYDEEENEDYGQD